jgi:hypothetical protein
MVVTCSSATSGDFHLATWRYIPEDIILGVGGNFLSRWATDSLWSMSVWSGVNLAEKYCMTECISSIFCSSFWYELAFIFYSVISDKIKNIAHIMCSERRLIGHSLYTRNFLRKSCVTCRDKCRRAAPRTKKSEDCTMNVVCNFFLGLPIKFMERKEKSIQIF